MGRYTGKKCRLLTQSSLTTAFFLVELVVGYMFNSMALIADSFHMLSDIAALIIAFLSVRMAPKSWDKNTFGWARAEVLGALVNAVFLVALCFSIFMEVVERFFNPEAIDEPVTVLIVGCLGLLVNLIGLLIFARDGSGHGHSHGGHGHSHASQYQRNHSHLSNLASSSADSSQHFRSPDVLDKRLHVPDSNGGVKCGDKADNGEKADNGNGGGGGGSAAQMNMRGVFLHVLSDALGSVIVIISALILIYTPNVACVVSDDAELDRSVNCTDPSSDAALCAGGGMCAPDWIKYVDPTLSLILVSIILRSTWPLLIEASLILLQTVPTHIDVDKLKEQLQKIEGIIAVHEFHVWQLAGDRIIASAHIRCENYVQYMKVAERVKTFFHDEGIHSTTIQPEFVVAAGMRQASDVCQLSCPRDPSNGDEEPNCSKSQCCPASNKDTPTIVRRRSINGADIAASDAAANASAGLTSTPVRPHAASSSAIVTLDLSEAAAAADATELTAELDLSDVSPLDNSTEATPMVPRVESRVVSIVKKQSNV